MRTRLTRLGATLTFVVVLASPQPALAQALETGRAVVTNYLRRRFP